jgi:hypothetical protein
MQTVWILFYLNSYLVHFGVFASEQDALAFVADDERASWCRAVQLPIQPSGATYETMIKPAEDLPRAGQR